MPIQMPQWTEFLSCPICFNMFNEVANRPISLACGHTVCKACLSQLQQKKCPFDQAPINRNVDELPVNFALLQLVGVAVPEVQEAVSTNNLAENLSFYNSGKKCIEELAMLLKPVGKDSSHQAASSGPATTLSRPMQRKLVTLVNCQLVEEEGRTRAMRAARSLGERSVTELILQHQNPQQLSANLWAAVRTRGCQFLGPGMQEEVLRLILLALEDGSALSRKVLVLFVVQRLEAQYPQASKTAIGHVVQLLYRASCFKVSKREEESSLMQLKEEFRGYESLRREHDAQIVQIATEAGLRISPEQWSSLLYGDTAHKSHMQSIIDKLQTPQSFSQSVHELVIALQRTGDTGNLSRLRPHLDLLSSIDPSPDAPSPSWENLEAVMKAIKTVVQGLVEFIQSCSQHRVDPPQLTNAKYRTSMCRDLAQKGSCPRGANCTFAHSQDEMEKFRIRNRKLQRPGALASSVKVATSSALTAKQMAELTAVSKSAEAKLTVPSNGQSGPQVTTSQMAMAPKSGIARQSFPRGSSIKVPVAKAMTLSQNHRGRVASMIYTSPTVAAKNQQPNVVPISQHMLSTRIPVENPYYQPQHIPLPMSPNYHSPPAQHPRQTMHVHMVPPPEGTIKDTGEHSLDAEAMASIPHSPHLRDYYIASEDQNYQQQTCTEHLESLHSRKKELLAQLRNTRNDNAHGKHVSPENRTESSSRYPGDNGTRGGLMCSTTTCFSGPCVSEAAFANCLDTTPQRKGIHDPDDIDMMYIHESIANSIAVTRTAIAMTSAIYTGEDYTIPASPPNLHQWSRASLDVTADDVSDDEVDICYSLADTGGDEFDESEAVNDLADDDEFIPFEHTRVSKYGPISRNMIRANQTRNTDPLAVTASFSNDSDPVTAVMFMKRPFPVVMEMPTQYAPGGRQVTASPQAAAHEGPAVGYKVASSLPTTNIRPSLLVAGTGCEGQTVQSLKERMLNMPNMHKPAARSTAEREQIRHELVQLNKQIDHLEGSEHERLTRELQAVDMNIQETERQMDMLHNEAVEFAHLQQELQVSQAKDKQEQETRDRMMAERIAMEEAEANRVSP